MLRMSYMSQCDALSDKYFYSPRQETFVSTVEKFQILEYGKVAITPRVLLLNLCVIESGYLQLPLQGERAVFSSKTLKHFRLRLGWR